MMWKTHKKTILLTMVLSLLPMIAGVVLWEKLPEMLATHFGADNAANGWMSKPIAVFGFPVLCVALEGLSVFSTDKDPRRAGMDEKAKNAMLWLFPAISWVCNFLTYSYSMGMRLNVSAICGILLGLILMALGNYMPKNETNHTFGIRTRWTLEDEETWHHSQRFGGFVMTIGGLLVAVAALLGLLWVMIAVIVLSFLLPIVYSYIYYQRHHT